MICEIVLFNLHSICVLKIITLCMFPFPLELFCLTVICLLTFSWIVQHCRGLSNLLWHEFLDDLPDTWDMRHPNRAAFVPWPCKVTLVCCSKAPTVSVEEHSYTECLEVCRVGVDQVRSERRGESWTRIGDELWANGARAVCWSSHVSTSVLKKWFLLLRSG